MNVGLTAIKRRKKRKQRVMVMPPATDPFYQVSYCTLCAVVYNSPIICPEEIVWRFVTVFGEPTRWGDSTKSKIRRIRSRVPTTDKINVEEI